MPIPNYGVLKGSFVAGAPTTHGNPHYHLQVQFTQNGQVQNYEVPINTKSQDNPPSVLFNLNNNFQNDAITAQLVNMEQGYTPLQSVAGGVALDYVLETLFNWSNMQPIPTKGLDDDIAEFTNGLPSEAVIYCFGQQYGSANYNKYLDFQPDGGIHDIHMNQGNTGNWSDENGSYQDGGLLVNIPSTNQWYGLFFAFQSQAEVLEQNGQITLGSSTQPATAGN